MISWYMPTWHGDLRINQIDAGSCELVLYKATATEKAAATAILAECSARGWCHETRHLDLNKRKARVVIKGPMVDVGPIASRILRPGDAVLTAVVFKDGHVETSSKHEGPSLEDLTKKALTPYRDASPDPEEPAAETTASEPDKATALATVKRPTPCCPQCKVGAIEPATEALLAFLTPDEHEQWRRERTIVVTGGLSGFRYLVAHRNSTVAAKIGRMCFDLDTRQVMHFHDNSVPPEEEVLAVKLILEHREPWLRNEATCFGGPAFKNPFGGGGDGLESSIMASNIGRALGVRNVYLNWYDTDPASGFPRAGY